MTIDRLCQILLEQLRLEIITADKAIEQLKVYYAETKEQKNYLKELKNVRPREG